MLGKYDTWFGDWILEVLSVAMMSELPIVPTACGFVVILMVALWRRRGSIIRCMNATFYTYRQQ